MGTHSLTHFVYPGGGITSFFRHFDGYPRIHGRDLYNFLLNRTTTNVSDIVGDFTRFMANTDEDGPNATVKHVYKAVTEREEWTYIVTVKENSFFITVYRYNDFMFEGKMKDLKRLVDEHGGIVAKAPIPDGEYGAWESPDVGVCESIALSTRNDWSKELLAELANDPSTAYCGSGDRVMVAMVDDVTNGIAHVTIEDCIITRRMSAKISVNNTPAKRDDDTVRKTELSSKLADLANCMGKFNGLHPAKLVSWADEMCGWIEEINQLTMKDK